MSRRPAHKNQLEPPLSLVCVGDGSAVVVVPSWLSPATAMLTSSAALATAVAVAVGVFVGITLVAVAVAVGDAEGVAVSSAIFVTRGVAVWVRRVLAGVVVANAVPPRGVGVFVALAVAVAVGDTTGGVAVGLLPPSPLAEVAVGGGGWVVGGGGMGVAVAGGGGIGVSVAGAGVGVRVGMVWAKATRPSCPIPQPTTRAISTQESKKENRLRFITVIKARARWPQYPYLVGTKWFASPRRVPPQCCGGYHQ
jgi:hypothetical protein